MFTLIDYIIFVGMVILSTVIGIYFGFSKKAQTKDEYLLGSRTMKSIPIALSLIASQISGITLLALPSDVYVFGINNVWMSLSVFIATIMGSYIYLPVIMTIKSPSVFSYLEVRFGNKIKLIASFIYTLQMLLHNPIVAYFPALAFSQATGIHPYIIIPIINVICIFYTTVGGFKAVVWTDVLQFGGMMVSIIAVLVLGVISVGGFNVVFEKAQHGYRLDFNFSPDLTKRDGFWQMILGCTIIWIYNINLYPAAVQKYLSVSTLSNAKKVICLQCCGIIAFQVLGSFAGIVMYAKYQDCDPITTGKVTRMDQLIIYFAMELTENIPGLLGIFIAGVLSATLSTLSTTYNTLAATVYSDFIAPHFPDRVLKNRETYILKLIVVISGIICTILTFFVERMGGLLAFHNSLMGLIFGIFVGLFSLGMIFPSSNSKGAFWGVVASFFVVGTITVLNQWYSLNGIVENFGKPVSVEGCNEPFNVTVSKVIPPSNQPFILFRLSFWCNAFMSAVMVTVIGVVLSCATKKDRPSINSDLLCPIVWCREKTFNWTTIGNTNNTRTYRFEDKIYLETL